LGILKDLPIKIEGVILGLLSLFYEWKGVVKNIPYYWVAHGCQKQRITTIREET
jgi:hypothetical protein